MRLTAVLTTVVLVFVLAYLAACVAAWPILAGRMSVINHHFVMISSALDAFERSHGRYPDSLGELAGIDEGRDLFDEAGRFRYVDFWQNPYQYERTEEGYRLNSLGRDGQPGGKGLDADIEFDPQSHFLVKPTFGQFLFDLPDTGNALALALLTSLCAGLVCYRSTIPREGNRGVRLHVVLNMTAVIVASAFIAIILAFIYLTGEHH